MAKCEKKKKKAEFCTIRGNPKCNCGTNYRTVRLASWRQQARFYQAHHILPVAVVRETLAEKTDIIAAIEEGTTWCINKKVNIMPLPLWADTILWYAMDFAGLTKRASDATIVKGVMRNKSTPDFENLPQHNYGHTGQTDKSGYNEELRDKLSNAIDVMAEKREPHDIPYKDICDLLDRQSEKWEQTLAARGIRQPKGAKRPGTDECWRNAEKIAQEEGKWYEPFCMARVPTPIPFAGSEMISKIIKVARRMLGG